MRATVLCVDECTARSRGRGKALEAAGFAVLQARSESQALELLKSHRVDVVCIVPFEGDAHEPGIGHEIKNAQPDVPLVLIHGQGVVPVHFEEYIDIVIDEPDFEATAQWLIPTLQDTSNFFFVGWFVSWMRRPRELNADSASQFLNY